MAEMPVLPGRYTQVLPLPGGAGLRYTLAVPAGPGRPLPLVLALHYGWTGAAPPRYYGGGFLATVVAPALAGLGALLVAPDCPGRDWTGPESAAGVLALLEHLRGHYALAAGRTLVVGYSLGGMGAWHWADAHPDLFRAAIPMAAWPPPGVLARGTAVPLYLIHSRADEVVPLEPTAAAAQALRARGAAVELVVVEGVGHYDTAAFVEPMRAAVPWVRGVWES